jgi:hypothetical protein
MKKVSLRSASDTCRRMIGRHARGIASSGFVTRVVMRLVVALEAPLRQIFVFNEEASLRAANATCRHATGRCFRCVVSSDFWRFFECGRVLWGFYTEFKGLFVLFPKAKIFLRASESLLLLAFSGEFPPLPSFSFFLRFSSVGLFRSTWIP